MNKDKLKNILNQFQNVPEKKSEADAILSFLGFFNPGFSALNSMQRNLSISEHLKDALTNFVADEPELHIFNSGKMFNFGNSASVVQLDHLIWWLASEVKKSGVDQTIDYLEKFLKIDQIPGCDVLVISGLVVESPFDLSKDIQVLPFASLPESHAKLFLSSNNPFAANFFKPQPASALIFKNPGGRKFRDESFAGLSTLYQSRIMELEEARLFLTLIGPSAPCSIANWWQAEDWVPVANQVGGGWAGRIYDVIHGPSHKITEEEKLKAIRLYEPYSKLKNDHREKLRIPLERLNQAIRRLRLEDQAIDLGIALESLFFSDNTPDREPTLAFRLRGAWLLGDDSSRITFYEIFKALYDMRSKAVHGGHVKHQITIHGQKKEAKEVLAIGFRLAALAIEKIISLGSFPDWDSLILGKANSGAQATSESFSNKS